MSPLNPEQWQALSPYLDQALTLSKEECALWLQSLRTEKPEIADKLRVLLEEHRAVNQERYLETGPALSLDSGAPGQNIGPYRLISIIGRGGMGTVWLAERFRREGAILGRLSHVNIAELLDAGVTATGQPYLVLEHVEGESIDRYCDQHRLSIDQRIK